MTHFQNKEHHSDLKDRLMERIFNFPRLYRVKMWTVNHAFKLIQPWIMKNHFTFDEVLTDIVPEDSRVFEIGCGDGKLYQRLSSHGKNLRYVGSDINKSMIEFCRSKFPEATWQHYDALPYPYPDEYFDYCIIENVLHHLNNYDTVCSLLKEAMRVSRHVVFFEPLQSNNKLLCSLKSVYWRLTDGGKFYFTYSEFHTLFNNTGAQLKWEKFTEPLRQLYSCEISRFKSG